MLTSGAIVHYDPTPETDIPVKPEGLLLIDSGGQYLDGTTDITHHSPGPFTWEMKRDYTLVLKGFNPICFIASFQRHMRHTARCFGT